MTAQLAMRVLGSLMVASGLALAVLLPWQQCAAAATAGSGLCGVSAAPVGAVIVLIGGGIWMSAAAHWGGRFH